MVLRGDEITPIIRVSQRSCQTNDVPSAFARRCCTNTEIPNIISELHS